MSCVFSLDNELQTMRSLAECTNISLDKLWVVHQLTKWPRPKRDFTKEDWEPAGVLLYADHARRQRRRTGSDQVYIPETRWRFFRKRVDFEKYRLCGISKQIGGFACSIIVVAKRRMAILFHNPLGVRGDTMKNFYLG